MTSPIHHEQTIESRGLAEPISLATQPHALPFGIDYILSLAVKHHKHQQLFQHHFQQQQLVAVAAAHHHHQRRQQQQHQQQLHTSNDKDLEHFRRAQQDNRLDMSPNQQTSGQMNHSPGRNSLSNSVSEHQQTSSPMNRKKKTRTVFTRNQVFRLETMFQAKKYLSSSERSQLACSLHLSETQVKIWFQNRRNKCKRNYSASDASPCNPFDWNQISAFMNEAATGNPLFQVAWSRPS